jgi:nitroreductase
MTADEGSRGSPRISKAIAARRAYRALDSAPIGKDLLTRLAEAAHLAPSSANNQPWRIITVIDPVRLEALKATLSAGNYWAKRSPAITAFVTDPDWSLRIDGREFAYFELGMAAMAYQVQAVEEGLIAHPIVGFDAQAAKQVLAIPEKAVLEILMVLGFPGDTEGLSPKHLEMETSARSRKALGEVAAFDAWNEGLVPAL